MAEGLQQIDTDIQTLVRAVNRIAETLTQLIPGTPPSVTGSRGGNVALASLLTALAAENLIIDNTTP